MDWGSDMSGLNTCTDLKEETYNFYGGVEKSFNDKLSLSLSVAGEYYKLMNYKKWAVYPAMQLSYAFPTAISSSWDFLPIRRIRSIGLFRNLLVI